MATESDEPVELYIMDIRDAVRTLIEDKMGASITGAGYNFVDKEADISFDFHGKSYWLSLRETSGHSYDAA